MSSLPGSVSGWNRQRARCLAAVELFSRAYHNESPPYSLTGVLDHYGVAEVRSRLLNQDARLILEGRYLVIETNRLFPEEHQRVSMAHEVGHIILNDCLSLGPYRTSRGDPAEEDMCDFIAGNLLVPTSALCAFLGRTMSDTSTLSSRINCSVVLAAAGQFRVPVDVIARRIFQDLGLDRLGVAIIWHFRKGKSGQSRRVLRVTSSWHRSRKSPRIPIGAPAPTASVISKAYDENEPFCEQEFLRLGRLRGRFRVEAASFPLPTRGVLSLLT